jgi:alkane 1-monooxygenase
MADTLRRVLWRGYPALHALTAVTALTSAVFVVHMLQRALDPWVPVMTLYSIFIGTIVLDVMLGQHSASVPRAFESTVARSPIGRVIPGVVALLIPASVVGAAIVLGPRLIGDPLAFLGAALMIGFFNAAIGITAAHELIHRPSRMERSIGALTLTLFCYGTFFREHVHGHHVDAGTEQDPSTARLNESVYRFLPRAITGNVRKAWAIERRLLAEAGHGTWSYRNITLWLVALSCVWIGFLALSHSLAAALFFVTQAVFAIVTLETINYVQHYGLVRCRDGSGRLEPFSVRHAWNSSFWFTSITLLLPLPIFLMLVIAYVPPLWCALMNPRAEAANAP